jgi:hypothetical protein
MLILANYYSLTTLIIFVNLFICFFEKRGESSAEFAEVRDRFNGYFISIEGLFADDLD